MKFHLSEYMHEDWARFHEISFLDANTYEYFNICFREIIQKLFNDNNKQN